MIKTIDTNIGIESQAYIGEKKASSTPDWFVDIRRVRTDYVVIENLQQFLAPKVPLLHPDHPNYITFWSQETKKCIEGIWGFEFGKYRYMPGNLYFFGSYTIIEHTFEEDGVKVTEDIKPKIVDYIWDFGYDSWVCYGFSGYTMDTLNTCHYKAKMFEKGEISFAALPESCKHNGRAKKYREPREYIEQLQDKPLGKPLFQNPTSNEMVMGSRGGTKSYWVSNGEIEYNFIFGGARRYNQKFIDNKYKSAQCVGAADAGKSSDLLNKFKASQDAKINADNSNFVKWFGIWTEPGEKGDDIIYPCPFYKRTSGTLECPNKKPNKIFRASYKIERNGIWVPKGTGSSIAHINYSDKKGNGARAAEGGRYLFSNVEEVGAAQNFIDILGANEGVVTRAGARIGVQWSQGTSGNITYVQAAKKVFHNPASYTMLGFPDKCGTSRDPIGRYIPFYITLLEHKDKNGNTNYQAALAEVNRLRAEAASSTDPKVLRDFLMNKPCYTHEMWITDKGHYLPIDEIDTREKQLLEGDLYKRLGTPHKLVWDSEQASGVRADVFHDGQPYVEFPHDPAKKRDPSGCIVIYQHPEFINGVIPHDLYIFGLDPYVEEDIDKGGSVGALYVLINPKYITSGVRGNTLAATYIGKPIKGLAEYYENMMKLLAYYGNPIRGLWFEKNRGETCRETLLRKSKANLMALTPQITQGSNVFQKNIVSYGYVIGNKISKIQRLKDVSEWLLESTELPEDGVKQNIFRFPCIYTIRQMQQYDIDDNFDGVDGFRGCVIGLREKSAADEIKDHQKTKTNNFNSLLNNPSIFKQARHAHINRFKGEG